MNPAIKKILLKPRVIILLVFLLLSIVSIHPTFGKEGIAIRNVIPNSSASDAGLTSPRPTATPTSREVIVAINNIPVTSVNDYHEFVETLSSNVTFTMQTDKGYYRIITQEKINTTMLPELINITIEEVVEEDQNGTLVNVTANVTKEVNKTLRESLGVEDVGISVYPLPKNNIRKGLDLEGGTRVLLQPERILSSENMSLLLLNMEQRLNVYGLSDVIVREAGDLSGNQYILVEIAGANKQEVKELLARQGKFEAKIGNDTVFTGGADITYVCRSADCAGIDPNSGCSQSGDGWSCRFRFSIALSPKAARRQASLTENLTIIPDEFGNDYLEMQLSLFLDDTQVDALNIGSDLRGRAVTDISISGSGVGITQQAATYDTLENMKRLQTVLVTGSLPVKLNIVQTDNISPALGSQFLKNAVFVGLMALIAVALVVYVRYRKWAIALPMFFTMGSEIVLLLGIASLIGWNIDLAAIAGIIIAVGTGVDDQIVITDEVLSKEETRLMNWKQKLKAAFGIIMTAYFTTVVAMLPLLFAGAGLLKGFALTTIMGVTFGVFITRPAFADIIKILLNE